MGLAAAMGLRSAERMEECNACCKTRVASPAAEDSVAGDVKTSSSLVLPAALVAIVQSVLELSVTGLDMEEAGSIVAMVATESMDYAAVV